MDNLFDSIQGAAHTVVGNTMGYTATWAPSSGGDMQTARVLLNKPTQKAEISDQEYLDISPKMEYLEGDFVGLVEAVRANSTETIMIGGIAYNPYKVVQKFAGKTIIIHIEPAE